jgi:nitrilase
MAKVAAIQMVSCAAVGPNLLTARMLMQKAVDAGAELLVLPENFALVGMKDEDKLVVKEAYGHGRIQDFLAQQAQALGVWIVGGTIPLLAEHSEKKIRSSCIVWNAKGEAVGRYDKIHLFDVYLGANLKEYRESDVIEPGNSPVVIQTPVGKVGLGIGYDLRFPELARELRAQGAEILVYPCAFTAVTGRAHWRTLLRARAIENQCYVVAANQGGVHDNQQETFGHSMIVDGWGEILACQEVGIGTATAELDLIKLQILREEFPSWEHRRL